MFCEAGGVNVYYEVVGAGIPVLMLHGYGIDHSVMAGCMEPVFQGRPGYRRIYIDLPGMGRSKAPD
jgi:pimeloyl-ACP methyl ester carboxylesterase